MSSSFQERPLDAVVSRALRAWRALRGEAIVGWVAFNHLLCALSDHTQSRAWIFDLFFFLNSCVCQAVDDVLDRELDASVPTKKHRYAFWTHFGLPALVGACGVTIAGSVAFAAHEGWLPAYLAWLVVALTYTRVWKRSRWFVKNGAVAVAVCLGYQILASGYDRALPMVAVVAVLAKVMWSELLLDTGDRRTDRAAGVRTAAVMYGMRRSAWILVVFQVVALVAQIAVWSRGSGAGWNLINAALTGLLLVAAAVDQVAMRHEVPHDGWRRYLLVVYEFALVLAVLVGR